MDVFNFKDSCKFPFSTEIFRIEAITIIPSGRDICKRAVSFVPGPSQIASKTKVYRRTCIRSETEPSSEAATARFSASPSPRPVYFRSRKLHPISYPPSPFHSPRFISSSDPVPSRCCLCFPAANLETRICIILDFGNFGNDRGITESCACGLWSY